MWLLSVISVFHAEIRIIRIRSIQAYVLFPLVTFYNPQAFFSSQVVMQNRASILLAEKQKGLGEVKVNTCEVGSLWDGKLLELHPIPSQHVAFLRAANRWLCGETDGTDI